MDGGKLSNHVNSIVCFLPFSIYLFTKLHNPDNPKKTGSHANAVNLPFDSISCISRVGKKQKLFFR
jgi:hypothetical protein